MPGSLLFSESKEDIELNLADFEMPSLARLRSTDLPDVDDEVVSVPLEITPETDLSTLTPAQLYDLNQKTVDESASRRPLIDEIEPISVLRAEYENGSSSFVQQIDFLDSQGFRYVRRTRGDGDCFYRCESCSALAFAYVESLMQAPDLPLAVATAISTLSATLPMLEKAGFQRLVFDDFYDELASLIQWIITPDKNGRTLTPTELLTRFQSPAESNSIVVFLRLLTSAKIRTEPEDYQYFITHPELGYEMELRDFCEGFVEAVGKEADDVQITALSRALQVNVRIARVDGHDIRVSFDDKFGTDESIAPLTLLFRPGHYDILVGPDGAAKGK